MTPIVTPLNHLLIAVSICAGLATMMVASAAPGDLDRGFNVQLGPDEQQVFSIAAQSDGKLIVGTATGGVFRANLDGSRDGTFTFAALPIIPVYDVTVTVDGQILLDGVPTADPARRTRTIIRLNSDGTLDNTFATQFDPGEYVRSFAPAPSDKIVYFGEISQDGVGISTHLQRLLKNGSIDDSFVEAAGERTTHIWSLAVLPDGKVLVGSDNNTSISGQKAALLRLNHDGTVDASFHQSTLLDLPPFVPLISSIVPMADGRIMICGPFSGINNRPWSSIARLFSDGTLDTSFSAPPMDSNVSSVFVQPDGKVIGVGAFNQAGSSFRKRIARFNRDGSLDEGYAASGFDYTSIKTSAMSPGGQLYISGATVLPNGQITGFVYRLESGDFEFGPPVFDTTLTNQVRLLGQNLTLQMTVCSVPSASYQWRYNGAEIPGATNALLTFTNLQYQDGGTYILVASNTYGSATSSPVHLLVNAAPILAGSVDPTFDVGNNFNQGVAALRLDGDKVLSAGIQSSPGGPVAGQVIRLNPDGSADGSFNQGKGLATAGNLTTLELGNGGTVFIGGYLTGVKGKARRGVARLNGDGSLDTGFVPGFTYFGAAVSSIVPYSDGGALVAGCFNSSCSLGIVRLKTTGAIDDSFAATLGFKPYTTPKLGAQKSGKIIVAGPDSNVHESVRRLNPDGSIDSDFNILDLANNSALLDTISLCILDDDRILVGFSSAPKVTQLSAFRSVLRLDAGGQIDTNLNFLGNVASLCALPDGNFLVGGYSDVTRVFSNGVKDTNFVCQTDGAVNALAAQADGNILIGGEFTKVNGVPRLRIARIFGKEHASPPFLFGPFLSVGGFELRIPTVTGYTYALEAADAVNSKAWKLLATMAGDGSYQTVTDAAPGASQRFYRVTVK
ncbi:MAG: hypothetical protein HY043_15175 [Verrucomicrobia bacterium]|nr:hypothetical protein [Verrucomicrobiota bacterium]